MKSRTQEWVLAGVVTIASAITVVTVGTVLTSSDGWLYDHVGTICLSTGVAFALVVYGIVVIWNHDKPTTKVIAATALIAATAATASAGDKNKSSGITTGLTNPYGNSSVSSPTWPFGWLTRGWDFGWGFWRDGLDSWQSGHPVITIDPEPPSSSDTSSK